MVSISTIFGFRKCHLIDNLYIFSLNIFILLIEEERIFWVKMASFLNFCSRRYFQTSAVRFSAADHGNSEGKCYI